MSNNSPRRWRTRPACATSSPVLRRGWRSTPAHEPILWRHVIWDWKLPDREAKEHSPWGWLFYRRAKTDKAFYRPMNRVVHAPRRSREGGQRVPVLPETVRRRRLIRSM